MTKILEFKKRQTDYEVSNDVNWVAVLSYFCAGLYSVLWWRLSWMGVKWLYGMLHAMMK